MILGILASSISGSKAVTNSYESIATVSVGVGGTAAAEFTSIPSTYAHLQIRAIGKSDSNTNTFETTRIQFNSDTGANYSWHQLYTVNGTVYAGAGTSASLMYSFDFPFSGSNYTNIFGAGVIDILDYANTNKYKTMRTLGGVDSNSASVDYGLNFVSGNWRSTNAITSIKIYPQSGNWARYSHFALYGIKA